MENRMNYYPAFEEVDTWLEEIWEESEKRNFTVEKVDTPIFSEMTYMPYTFPQVLKFTVEGTVPFYATWYAPIAGPKPLLCFLPGYGGEMTLVPSASAYNFACISVAPMGYWTPKGIPYERKEEGYWPVYPDTVRSKGKNGYHDWLLQAAIAVKWAWTEQKNLVIPDRVSFYGTSQGGGTALLMGSLFANRGTKCVMADEPYLTNAPLADFKGAYFVLKKVRKEMEESEFWHYVGLVDTLQHARRLKVPVLVTTGTKDDTCPPETVKSLYEMLPETKMFLELKGRGHGHNPEFERIALAFADMYA